MRFTLNLNTLEVNIKMENLSGETKFAGKTMSASTMLE